jgi:hypothetical protein
MSNKAYMQYEHESGIVARWHGGAYINLGTVQAVGAAGIDGDDFHAYAVINVWDYAIDAPRIARTLDAFQARVDEFVAEQDAE